MQIVKYIIIIAISIIIGFIAGYLIRPVEKGVVVKEVKVTETKYKYIPVTEQEKNKCIQSPILIKVIDNNQDNSIQDNQIKIIAGDDCKEAEAIITLDSKSENKYLVYSFMAGALITFIIMMAI